jgi:protein-S-isoprenylcysteine O-methyltransferase Ste14
VAGLIPWWLTGWRFETSAAFWGPIRVVGAVLILIGAPVLVAAFVRFVVEGLGTPAPVAPTQKLVVGGLYRYVRNPMYIAVLTVVVGEALLFGQPGLLIYAAAAGGAMWVFATYFEEPSLAERFGEEYESYRRAVPGWWPRLTPWSPDR